MQLDLGTLMVGDSLVAGASGLMLLLVWLEDRSAISPLLWSLSDFCLAGGIIAMAAAFGSPDEAALLCTALFGATNSLVLAGALRFEARPAAPPLMLLGLIVSLLMGQLATAGVAPRAMMALSQAIPVLFPIWAAVVLWRGRRERLKARLPAVCFLLVHATAIGLLLFAQLGSSVSMAKPAVGSVFGLIHFETVIYAIGLAVLLTSMLRERKEAAERRNAVNDSLVPGLLNRRGLVGEAERLLNGPISPDMPMSLLMFDIDHFKRVNDTFGHHLGDEVLIAFGRAARRALRAQDVLGRLGGEEFAALLPGTGLDCAIALAERTRTAFMDATRLVEGQLVRATVSVGVVTTDHGPASASCSTPRIQPSIRPSASAEIACRCTAAGPSLNRT